MKKIIFAALIIISIRPALALNRSNLLVGQWGDPSKYYPENLIYNYLNETGTDNFLIIRWVPTKGYYKFKCQNQDQDKPYKFFVPMGRLEEALQEATENENGDYEIFYDERPGAEPRPHTLELRFNEDKELEYVRICRFDADETVQEIYQANNLKSENRERQRLIAALDGQEENLRKRKSSKRKSSTRKIKNFFNFKKD